MDITSFIVNQRDKALLVGDYGSYRKQLSRRLLVVRKKLNYATKGRKYTPKSPITVEDIVSNHEYVVLMCNGEVHWAECDLGLSNSYCLLRSGPGRWPCT